jgi:hypothetical protein
MWRKGDFRLATTLIYATQRYDALNLYRSQEACYMLDSNLTGVSSSGRCIHTRRIGFVGPRTLG